MTQAKLSARARWKIADGLRRSLLRMGPAAAGPWGEIHHVVCIFARYGERQRLRELSRQIDVCNAYYRELSLARGERERALLALRDARAKSLEALDGESRRFKRAMENYTYLLRHARSSLQLAAIERKGNRWAWPALP